MDNTTQIHTHAWKEMLGTGVSGHAVSLFLSCFLFSNPLFSLFFSFSPVFPSPFVTIQVSFFFLGHQVCFVFLQRMADTWERNGMGEDWVGSVLMGGDFMDSKVESRQDEFEEDGQVL
jgi:hypothetical protein